MVTRYCSGHHFKPHSSIHGSSLSNIDDLYQGFMNMPCEAQASSQSCYDPFASRLERSYKEHTQQNGKVVLNDYSLLETKGGKTLLNLFIFYTAQFQVWLLTMAMYLIACLELMRWLHWLHDYT